MKKITLWLFALLTCWQLEAQVSAYTFSQSTGTYADITGETILATQTTASGTAATSLDNVNYTIALPFDFTYAGVNYLAGTNIYVSTNGFVSFGSTAPATNTYTPIGSTNVYNGALSAFGADLNGGYAAIGTNVLGSPDLTITDGLASQFVVGAIVSGTGIPANTTVVSVSGSTVTLSANCTTGGATRTFHVATGKISYVVTNTAPNRTLVVQYKRMRRYDTTSRTLDFQIILNETSNTVSFVYGNPIGSATAATPQVGLRGANNTLFNNRTSTSDWSATTAGATNTATVTYSSTVLPVSGLTYTWTPPSCSAPGGFNATSILATTATINWSPQTPAPAVGYEYYYSTVNTAPTAAGTATTAATANLTGLMANTLYYVWLRSDCGGTQSAWSGPFSFRTTCVVYTTPYFEGFESGYTQDVSISDCITQESITGTQVWSANTSLTDYNRTPRTGAWNAYLRYGNEDWMFIPINLVGGTSYTISFYARQDGATATNSNVSASYGTTATAAGMTSVIVAATGIINGNYQQITGSFTPATSGTYYVGIKGFMNFSPYYISIDDISIDVTPSCIPPTNLTASNILVTTATINWNPLTPAPAVGYEYYYSTVNTAPVAAGTATTAATANLTGLTPNTTYYVWLRSDCGGTQSAWSAPFSFTTACNAFAVPFAEGFNSTSTTKSCWKVLNVNADADAWILNDTAFPYEGDQSASIYTDFNNGANNDYLISPSLALTGNQRLKFHYRVRSASEPNDFELLLSTTDTNPASFTNVLIPNTSYSNVAYQEVKIDLSSYSGNVYIAWHVPNGGLDGYYLYIDNVIVEDNPPCIEPNMFVSSNITTNSVDLSWNDPSGTQFDYEYVVQPQGGPMPTGSGTSVGDLMVTVNSLIPGTMYEAWVRAYCNVTEQSIWVGPINFTTLCVSVTDFVQDFEATTGAVFPACWKKVGASGSAYPQTSTGISGSRNLYMYSSSAISRPVVSMRPVSNANAGTHRMNMKVRANFTVGETIELGYLTNPNDAATFTSISSIVTNSTTVPQSFITVPSGMPSGDVVFALRTGTLLYSVLIDDVKWEVIPSTPPSCASNIVATPNATCGNYSNVITWNSTPSANGYYITIGTSTGASDIANNIDIASATTYSFSGTVNTTYFYKITPYNAIGNATGCLEQSFTTVSTACYCPSVPTSNDNSGITNVQLGATNFPTTDVTYFDHTATTVALAQGINSNVQITFATGYTYNTYVFIDFNNDYDFTDPGELVFTGESLGANPTTYNASFVMPPSAPLGNHRMRIVTADDLSTPDPCYSGSYGVTLDFTINVVAPSCTPPTFSSAVVTHNCVGSVFNVNVNVTALGDGSPSITDGVSNWPVTSTGNIQVGPFAYGTPVTLTLNHGSNNICNIPIGTYNYAACPPANDECANAVSLTVNSDYNCGSVAPGTVLAATASAVNTTACGGTEDDDVWYSFVATQTTHRVQLTNITGSTTDMYHSLWTGADCNSLTLVPGTCSDPNTSNPTGLTIGQTYYLRVYTWTATTGQTSAFNVCVGTNPVLGSSAFDLSGFKAYPNPVKEILTLEYNTSISSVRIMNLLGQEVMSRNINANEAKIDMSQLNSGAYIVNVVIDGAVQSIKVIKE